MEPNHLYFLGLYALKPNERISRTKKEEISPASCAIGAFWKGPQKLPTVLRTLAKTGIPPELTNAAGTRGTLPVFRAWDPAVLVKRPRPLHTTTLDILKAVSERRGIVHVYPRAVLGDFKMPGGTRCSTRTVDHTHRFTVWMCGLYAIAKEKPVSCKTAMAMCPGNALSVVAATNSDRLQTGIQKMLQTYTQRNRSPDPPLLVPGAWRIDPAGPRMAPRTLDLIVRLLTNPLKGCLYLPPPGDLVMPTNSKWVEESFRQMVTARKRYKDVRTAAVKIENARKLGLDLSLI